jgi:hypothetical protein
MPTTLFLMIATGFAAPALAEDTDVARFALEKTDGGFVRLDRKTGALTLCQESDGTLTCRMAADERAATRKTSRLERRVARWSGAAATAPLAKGEPLPSDGSRASIGIMERFMRSFFGLVEGSSQKTAQRPTRHRLLFMFGRG